MLGGSIKKANKPFSLAVVSLRSCPGNTALPDHAPLRISVMAAHGVSETTDVLK